MHTKGFGNVWADLLSCWRAAAVILRLLSIPFSHPPPSRILSGLLPTKFREFKGHFENNLPSHLVHADVIWKNPAGAIEFPVVPAIFNFVCPSSTERTPVVIADQLQENLPCKKHIFWSMLTTDIQTFIHFLSYAVQTLKGNVPRPFGPTVCPKPRGQQLTSVRLHQNYAKSAWEEIHSYVRRWWFWLQVAICIPGYFRRKLFKSNSLLAWHIWYPELVALGPFGAFQKWDRSHCLERRKVPQKFTLLYMP